jgi:hypothetical protein
MTDQIAPPPPEEVWRQIAGYEGYYEVSSYGRVRSVERETQSYRPGVGNVSTRRRSRLRKIRMTKAGYPFISLSKDGKTHTYSLAFVVASTFLSASMPSGVKKPYAVTRDGNRRNCAVPNLVWKYRRTGAAHG